MKTKHTPGAIRAAMGIVLATNLPSKRLDEIATIIDRETGAPELCEALRELLYVTEPLESDTLKTPFIKARAALAKAGGE